MRSYAVTSLKSCSHQRRDRAGHTHRLRALRGLGWRGAWASEHRPSIDLGGTDRKVPQESAPKLCRLKALSGHPRARAAHVSTLVPAKEEMAFDEGLTPHVRSPLRSVLSNLYRLGQSFSTGWICFSGDTRHHLETLVFTGG